MVVNDIKKITTISNLFKYLLHLIKCLKIFNKLNMKEKNMEKKKRTLLIKP